MLVWFVAVAFGVLLVAHLRLRSRVIALEMAAVLAGDTPSTVVSTALALQSPAFVLLVDDRCGACREVSAGFGDVASDYRKIVLVESAAVAAAVAAQPPAPDVEVVADERAFNALDRGIHPALVLVDGRGRVLDSSPVGSIERLHVLHRDMSQRERSASRA